MTIQEIIKKSLQEVKRRGVTLSPDVYEEIFCQQAKKANVIVEDCQKLEKYLKRLSPDLQKTVKSRHVSTVDQLVQYLASEVMRRADSAKTSEVIQAYVLLVKRLLQAVALYRDGKATAMADRDKEKIAAYLTREEIDKIREHWTAFVVEFDDSFLQKLALRCGTEGKELREIIEAADRCLQSGKAPMAELEAVGQLLVASLVPSIAPEADDELAAVSEEIRDNPEMLTSPGVWEDVKRAIRRRIELDKEAVTTQMSELDSIIEHINQALIRVIDCGESNHEAICAIQGELDGLDLQSDSFEVIHKKLLAIASSLEIETRMLSEEMNKSKEEVHQLQQRVRLLEQALRQERKRSATDTLTKLPNRRAIDDFLAKQEAAFNRYGDNYSVVIFDIDHFKSVNDTYGHDAGDVILASFGKMLRRYSREIDFVGRWGGEEFLVVLPKTDLEGAKVFAEKLRDVVSKSKFMYKNTRIPITASGGVAERASNPGLQETLKRADENLYRAKAGGRNRVEG
ncbi:MAG: diguanylate cyclase [Epsilonproteobacteria bacterium]|nr:diguanylate cyclase [Campylobacterota bacterium]